MGVSTLLFVTPAFIVVVVMINYMDMLVQLNDHIHGTIVSYVWGRGDFAAYRGKCMHLCTLLKFHYLCSLCQ